jgi:lysophospholipase L1-like esterase
MGNLSNLFTRLIFCLFLFSTCILFACSDKQENEEGNPIDEPVVIQKDTIRYLALGDSYTIGESVSPLLRYPRQLADSLNTEDFYVKDLKVVAVTGWTTSRLIEELNTNTPDSNYNLVSLLIGVNNQYQGKDFSLYEEEFPELLNRAIAHAKGDKSKVFVVSIPDYAYTPFGQGANNPQNISDKLDEYNAFAKSVCEAEGIPFFNITNISREGLERTELVASDGLHPSGIMYGEWVDLFYEEVKRLLQD